MGAAGATGCRSALTADGQCVLNADGWVSDELSADAVVVMISVGVDTRKALARVQYLRALYRLKQKQILIANSRNCIFHKFT